MRIIGLAMLAASTATLVPAAVAAPRATIVHDGPHPVPEVRIRRPGSPGIGHQAPTRVHVAERLGTREHGSAGFNRYPGYRMISRGGALPGYWSSPRYGISNYGTYGFAPPMHGSRWVRYYDDALLVDRHGRVVDGRYGMDFSRYGDRWGYDHRGIPVYGDDFDGEYGYQDRSYEDGAYDDYAYDHGGVDYGDARDIDYDRDYPYDHPYGGGHPTGPYGFGGYTMTETITTTTTPTIVKQIEYVDAPVAVHKPARFKKTRRIHRAVGRRSVKTAARCNCR